MDSFTFDPSLLAIPFVLGCVIAAVIAWFAMLGGSLKLSLGMTMKEPPGYFCCLVMVFLIMIGNIAVMIGMYVALGPQPWYIIACYQSLVQIVLMMVVARCNPFSAFFASICHSVFASIGTVAIALALLLFCGSALVGMEKRKRAESPYGSSQASSRNWLPSFESDSRPNYKKKRWARPTRYSANPFIN